MMEKLGCTTNVIENLESRKQIQQSSTEYIQIPTENIELYEIDINERRSQVEEGEDVGEKIESDENELPKSASWLNPINQSNNKSLKNAGQEEIFIKQGEEKLNKKQYKKAIKIFEESIKYAIEKFGPKDSKTVGVHKQ